ncbi:MAG: hypothetical protein LBL33_07950 [Tannerella sp.]|nr:hypothetical protein [Tannerella sp.]
MLFLYHPLSLKLSLDFITSCDNDNRALAAIGKDLKINYAHNAAYF